MLGRMSAHVPATRVPGEHLLGRRREREGLARAMHGGPAPGVRGEHRLGRRREREALDRLMQAARTGSGGVLVLFGEPGVGKTALLEYAIEASAGFRVARADGVEGEMELAFAALQNLCSPFLELVERLPQPQH